MLRKAFFYTVLASMMQARAGIVEDINECALPSMGKTVYFFGEEHTDPFDTEAVAQREELAQEVDTILDTHQNLVSCYLEADKISQKEIRNMPYFYTHNLCNQGAFFEQWYVPLARGYGKEVAQGQLRLSNFDIRDHRYARIEKDLRMLADGDITRDKVDFGAIKLWVETVDNTLQALLTKTEKLYPKKMISYVTRDMKRKKKQFLRTLDTSKKKKRTRYGYRALESFYNYTDLLADFTILNKVATDPREAIIIHAGSAHTENVASYFHQLIKMA